MAITLEQAKVGMADKVDQAVIDIFRRESFILQSLLFDNAVSPGTGGSTMTYGYTQLLTPSMAAGRKLNEEYTPGEAIKEKKTAEVKIFGGSFEVDRVLEDTAAKSEINFQLEEKSKATVNKFHNDFINGDSTVKETDFDGLDKLVTGTETEFTPTVSVDLSTPEKIKTNATAFRLMLDKWLAKLEGKPTMLLMNETMLAVMNSVAAELGFYTRSKDAFGQDVDNYKGIPMKDMGKYYNGTKSVDVIETLNGETSIYAVTLSLDGVHGISPTGNKVIKTYLPDLKAPGAVKKGEVEMLAGIALKKTSKAGAFRKIKIEEASA